MSANELTNLTVLVVEDDSMLRKQIIAYLSRLGAEAFPAPDLASAKIQIKEACFDLVITDVNLPDGLGMELMEKQIIDTQSTVVVVMTGEGSIKRAVEAMRLGAADYLNKPFDLAELPMVLGRALRTRQQKRIHEHRQNHESTLHLGPSLAVVERQLTRIVESDNRLQTQLPPVLLQGETGTGKTSFARWLHDHGPRHGEPFVDVNCSALPESLAESELFGHEKGAFTDAKSARIGLFEAASGGTLFLDEIPSLSPGLQAKVLKAIEERRIRKVGSSKDISIDTRVIAAANRSLKDLSHEKLFREDLYHRLNVLAIELPPLRQRGVDILVLAENVLSALGQRHRMPNRNLSASGKQRLLAYQWPGNVRELIHTIERAIIFEEGPELNFDALPVPLGSVVNTNAVPPTLSEHPEAEWLNPLYRFPEQGFRLEQAIQTLIDKALAQCGSNVSKTARMLGVTRDYLRYRIDPKA